MLHNVLLMYTYWEKPHQYTIKINDRCLKEIKIWLNVGVNMIKETDKGIIVLSGKLIHIISSRLVVNSSILVFIRKRQSEQTYCSHLDNQLGWMMKKRISVKE